MTFSHPIQTERSNQTTPSYDVIHPSSCNSIFQSSLESDVAARESSESCTTLSSIDIKGFQSANSNPASFEDVRKWPSSPSSSSDTVPQSPKSRSSLRPEFQPRRRIWCDAANSSRKHTDTPTLHFNSSSLWFLHNPMHPFFLVLSIFRILGASPVHPPRLSE